MESANPLSDHTIVDLLTKINLLQLRNQALEQQAVLLKHSEEKYRLLFVKSPQPMWIFDSETLVFLEANQAATAHYGYSNDEFLSMKMKDLSPSNDEVNLTEQWIVTQNDYIQTGEFKHIKKNGDIIDVEITAFAIIFKGQKAYHITVNDITRIKLAEELLKDEHRRLECIMESNQFATWEWNVQTGETIFNEHWASIIGYTLEELAPISIKTWEKYTHPDDLILSNEQLELHFSGKIPYYDLECRMKHKNGNWIWVHTHGLLTTRSLDGKPQLMFGIHTDIDKRILANESLLLSETKFKNIFTRHDSIMLLIEPESGYIIDANDSAVAFYGYEKEALCQMNIYQINTLENKKVVEEYRNAVSNKKNYFVFRHRLANGEIRVVEVHSSPIQLDNKIILFSIIHDITDRHKIEEALIESEEKYRNVFKTESDALFLIDKDSSAILDVNDAACLLYGYTREELLNLKNTDVSAEPKLTEYATNNFINHVALRYHKKNNGNTFPVDISSSIFTMNNQTVILAAVRDITDRINIERILKEKSIELENSHAEKDKFFSIIAHDLRSPFNTFLGFTELLMEDLPGMKVEDAQNLASLMHKSAKNHYALLNDLLEWSLQQRKIICFNPGSFLVLDEVLSTLKPLRMLAEKKEILIQTNIPEKISVFADINMFKSTLSNLAINAIKFTHKKGNILISASQSHSGIITFSVCDSGIGLDKLMIENLFQLDSPANRKGTDGEGSTGLGLILCKDFIEQHKGKIWVESEIGKGSTFYFTLASDQFQTTEVLKTS